MLFFFFWGGGGEVCLPSSVACFSFKFSHFTPPPQAANTEQARALILELESPEYFLNQTVCL